MSQRSRGTRTRREFLADGARLAAGAALGTVAGCFPDVGGNWPPPPAPSCIPPQTAVPLVSDGRVVEVHSEGALKNYVVDPVVVRQMLATALGTLAGTATPWRTLLGELPSDLTIGLKINTLGGNLCTSPDLLKAIADSLKEELGLDGDHIVVWDRRKSEMGVFPGLAADKLGVRVEGTYTSVKDTSGAGYDEPMCGVVAGKAPRLSRIHTALTSFTINCPVLKTHTVSGVTAAMKNIYGIIDNPQDYHTNLATAMPQLYSLPLIGGRIRLTIVDALIAVTRGDTSSFPDTFPGRILVSLDPVAMDSRAYDLVNELRASRPPVEPPIAIESVAWLDNADGKLGMKKYSLVPVEV